MGSVHLPRLTGRGRAGPRAGRLLRRIGLALAVAAAMAVARPLALLTFAAIPLALVPVRSVRHGATGPALIGALGMTGRLQLAFGALLTIGLAIHL